MAKTRFLFILSFLIARMVFSQSFQMNKQIKGLELPSENAYSIAQDKKGRVWFATERGIYYSDGINTYGIPGNVKSSIGRGVDFLIDEEGIVWVFNTIGVPNVFYFSDEKWSRFELPYTLEGELKEGKTRISIIGRGDEKSIIISRGEVIAISKVESFEWDYHDFPLHKWGSLESVACFDEKGDDFYLLFSNHSAKHTGRELIPLMIGEGVLPYVPWSIHFNEQDSSFYFLGNDFLAVGKTAETPERIISTGFSEVTYDGVKRYGLQVKNGQVYYFFGSQLFKYNSNNGEILEITTFDKLKAFFINSAFVDRENIIWIATVRGTVNLPTLRFQNYDQLDGLLEHEVSAIERLGYRHYLYGFNNGIQLRKNGKVLLESTAVGQPGEPKNRVTSFHRDKNGVIWIASSRRGVGRFDPSKGSLEFYAAPDSSFVMNLAPKGNSLFIVAGKKVFLSDIDKKGKSLFEYDITDSLFNQVLGSEVMQLRKIDFMEDGKMVLMLGESNSQKMDVLENDSVLAFVGYDWEGKEGRRIFGTNEGLKVYEGDSLKFLEINGQHIDRPVYAILKDQNSNIWAGTDDGVAIVGNGTMRFFDEHTGLIGSEVNRGALVEGDNGKIMIGTQNGLSVFIPEEDESSFAKPLVSINSMNILGVGDSTMTLDRIPYEHNNVEYEFNATSFLELTNFTVSYMLEGFHSDWQHIQNPRVNKLQFNNLPPGDYRLLIKASLGGQFESDVVRSGHFSIIKPTYMQFWFISLIMFVFLMIGFGLNILFNQFKERGILQKSIDEKDQVIKTAEDQFRNVWESSRDGFALLNLDGHIMAVNPSLTKLAGLEGAVGHIKDIFRDENYFYSNKDRIVALLEKSGGKGGSFEALMPFYSGDKNIDLYVTRVNPKDEVEEIVLLVFRDVTDKKIYEAGLKEAKEKAEEANRIKTNFLSNMSHEIRTPLNGILGSTENIILQNTDNHLLIAQLEIIKESGERLLNTINSILDMSKIEANKVEVFYEHTNVNDFLSKILLPLKTLAIRKNLLLTAKFETKPFFANVDKRYLEMIVNNIVGNAIKYSEEGLIKLCVKKESENLLLRVEDTGIGMSKEFITNIYTPFEQESGGYDRKFEGTGLGLSITKNLIELLGGTIEITSEQKVGTTVVVTLPVN
ncbi:PAS domain S-box protein [Echinicola sp. CAU 1574]|uniref:histidine kinase n=1 Tax=Echinicola arenosa TaxID=2774144 RepID=A0ABR9ARL4_9BACT|nr:ATP-binding protein [Echinicola arenosa]MBD8491184.1 PAS domain S-box protein [Echinicola arenosa]